jgi:hypothetical protein
MSRWILGGNTELSAGAGLRPSGDGWFSSGHSLVRGRRPAPRSSPCRAARRGRQARRFPHLRPRRAHPYRSDLARYEAEGFEHVLVVADELWPRDGDTGRQADGVTARPRPNSAGRHRHRAAATAHG